MFFGRCFCGNGKLRGVWFPYSFFKNKIVLKKRCLFQFISIHVTFLLHQKSNHKASRAFWILFCGKKVSDVLRLLFATALKLKSHLQTNLLLKKAMRYHH